MSRITKGCSVLIVVLVLLATGLAIKDAWDNRDGRCILDTPRGEHIGGYVNHYGTIGKGVAYWLYYSGTYKHSGGTCKRGCAVTEAKYNLEMFGIGHKAEGG